MRPLIKFAITFRIICARKALHPGSQEALLITARCGQFCLPMGYADTVLCKCAASGSAGIKALELGNEEKMAIRRLWLFLAFLMLALWAGGKPPGLYSMMDVLGLN